MGTATLATLRERIRVMVESVTGTPAPLAVTASTATLATIRDRVEATLQDSANAIWSTDDIDEAIRKALEVYSRLSPCLALTSITVVVPTRELDISTIAGLTRVIKIWWTYDPATPGYPPKYVQFEVWPGAILYINDVDEPAAADQVRIWYEKSHTITDLDGGAATTIAAEDIGYIVIGAAGYAAQQRAIDLAEQATVDTQVVNRLQSYADDQLKGFRSGANMQPPAWQRYAYAYDQADIDEALRWALHRYNQVSPDRTISTLTFAATGYEVSTTTLTGLLDILKVWCPYTAADPEDPPEWRTFEQWPSILHITDEEIDIASIARIWYTRSHTLSGLDAAITTTVPDDHASILVTGAAGMVAQMRAQESQQTSVASKLREWSVNRLMDFDAMLLALYHRPAGAFVTLAPARRMRVPRE
jgi:hypothetical protein